VQSAREGRQPFSTTPVDQRFSTPWTASTDGSSGTAVPPLGRAWQRFLQVDEGKEDLGLYKRGGSCPGGRGSQPKVLGEAELGLVQLRLARAL
jgi:hypothetical protein